MWLPRRAPPHCNSHQVRWPPKLRVTWPSCCMAPSIGLRRSWRVLVASEATRRCQFWLRASEFLSLSSRPVVKSLAGEGLNKLKSQKLSLFDLSRLFDFSVLFRRFDFSGLFDVWCFSGLFDFLTFRDVSTFRVSRHFSTFQLFAFLGTFRLFDFALFLPFSACARAEALATAEGRF